MNPLPRLALAATLLSALLLPGCIERAPTPESRRAKFDRRGLDDVLVKTLPEGRKHVGANFDQKVEYVSITWTPESPQPGDKVSVVSIYRVLDLLDDDFKVFVHLEDSSGQTRRILADHWAAEGRYPTSAWLPGDVIVDRWSFVVPETYRGEKVSVWTGFYPPGKDDRLPLANKSEIKNDGANRILAATIPIR